jgi:O-antigen/teichoic acid export membrane protein
VKWTAASSIVTAVTQFTQVAMLARLLQPSDFGLMAMILIVFNFAQAYSDLGIGNAVIQRQDATTEQLSSLYWVNIIAGGLAFVIMACSTPLIVALYHEPSLYPLVPMSALALLIGSFGTQFQLLLQKSLQFKILATIEIATVVIVAIIVITAALAGLGVFALVIGQLTGKVISCSLLVSIGWRRWQPMFHLSWSDLDGYLSFGLYQMGERMLSIIYSKTDQLLIGALLGAEALGYYSLAWNIIFQPWSRINPIFTRVMFPLFARIQNETERLKRGYMMMIRIVALLSAPILLGFAAIAPLLVPVLYGPNWTPVILLAQIISGVGLIGAISNPIGTLILARGRADFTFVWTLGAVIVQIPGIFVGIYLGGLIGVALAVLVLHIVYLIAEYWLLIGRILDPSFGKYLVSAATPTLLAAVMAMIVWMIPNYVSASDVTMLLVQIGVGVLIYTVLTLMFQRSLIFELLAVVGLRNNGNPALVTRPR